MTVKLLLIWRVVLVIDNRIVSEDLSSPFPSESVVKQCIDCGQDFVFEPGEQKFFAAQGFDPPRRCPLCRKWKKFKNKERGSLASRPSSQPTDQENMERENSRQQQREQRCLRGRGA